MQPVTISRALKRSTVLSHYMTSGKIATRLHCSSTSQQFRSSPVQTFCAASSQVHSRRGLNDGVAPNMARPVSDKCDELAVGAAIPKRSAPVQFVTDGIYDIQIGRSALPPTL